MSSDHKTTKLRRVYHAGKKENQQPGQEITSQRALEKVALSRPAIFGDISETNMAYTKKATSINRGSFLAIEWLDTERRK
jgi:hypothetical protein